jgi:tetratricopeptide (TPR) repeat protein/KaiC/GvpD/RAD55 family RecA-like ATPase
LEPAIRLYNNVSICYEVRGNVQKALETRQKGFELGKRIGETTSTSWTGRALAMNYYSMGELQKAKALLEELLALSRRTKNIVGLAQALGLIGHVYHYLGEYDQAIQFLREAYQIAIGTKEYQTIAEIDALLGELLMAMEEYSEAEKYLNEGNTIFEKAGDTIFQVLFTLPLLARLHLMRGETEKTRKLIEKTEEYTAKGKVRLGMWAAEVLKGMLFKEQRNWEESIQHFEKGLVESKSLNAEKWYAHDQADFLYEYGSMHVERNMGDDKEKALNLLYQALKIYQKMGAKKDIEKVEARLAFMETGKVLRPKTAEPVSTGNADLDKMLYGGIASNSSIVLTSLSCSERDLLVRSFLETGAKRGEATFFVTIDPSLAKTIAEEFQSDFYLFVCNPEADAIIKDLPNVIKLKGVENLTDISIALTSAIRKLGSSLKNPRRICIGLISDVLLQHHALETRRWLTALMTKLKSEGFTTLAVMNPQMHPSQEFQAILDLFDGEISIREKETEKGLERYLRVRKMGNQKYLEDELLLKKEQS